MRNLLHACFFRWRKSRCLWVGAAAMACFCICMCLSFYRMGVNYDMAIPREGPLFTGAMLVNIVIAVFCSMFVGTEYSDGTIRNKMIAGHKRSAIYLANFAGCAAAGILFFAASVLSAFVTGSLLLDRGELPPSALLLCAADEIFMCVASAAVGTFIGMLIPNKAHASVAGILLALAFLLTGSYLSSRLGESEMYEAYDLTAEGELVSEMMPNPMYLSGTSRAVCEWMVDLLPGGQAYQIGNMEVARPYRILWCAAAETVALNAAGIWFFRRKDLK